MGQFRFLLCLVHPEAENGPTVGWVGCALRHIWACSLGKCHLAQMAGSSWPPTHVGTGTWCPHGFASPRASGGGHVPNCQSHLISWTVGKTYRNPGDPPNFRGCKNHGFLSISPASPCLNSRVAVATTWHCVLIMHEQWQAQSDRLEDPRFVGGGGEVRTVQSNKTIKGLRADGRCFGTFAIRMDHLCKQFKAIPILRPNPFPFCSFCLLLYFEHFRWMSHLNMVVSWNRDTPKSSILMGFSMK